MEVTVKHECTGVDWKTVAQTLKSLEMAYHEPVMHKKAFEASYVTVFLYHIKRLIGFGRAISDGAYQAAVYDCAVVKEFQRKGFGNIIIENILSRIPHCNVILYAAPGKEGFYEKHGFRKMKTGMARFTRSESMREKGITE